MRATATPPEPVPLARLVLEALADAKALDPVVLDVRGISTLTDAMVVASGTSARHLRTLAERVSERARSHGHRPLGTEGERGGEWILVDLGEAIVHLMLPRVRALYRLESLWGPGGTTEEDAGA
jgi:ribosome-associated protein